MKNAQPVKACWMMILISLALAITACGAKAPAPSQQGAQAVINKIEPHDIDGKTEITIEGTEPLQQYTSFELTEPLRLVVDIADTDIGTFRDKIPVNSGAIVDITPTQRSGVARLEIGLTQSVETKVYQAGGKIIVELSKPAEALASQPTATPGTAPTTTAQQAVAPQPEGVAATVVSSVKASAGKKGIRAVITADGTMKPNVFMVGKNRLVVDIPGTRSTVRPNIIPVRKGGLDKVRVGPHADKVRVVFDLVKPMQYTVTPEGNTLIVTMHVGAPGRTTAAKPQETEAAQQPSPALETAATATTEEQKTSEQAPPQGKQEVPEKETAASAPTPHGVPAAPAAGKKERRESSKEEAELAQNALLSGTATKYTGRKISLDLQDADLINVMRLFAEVANLNIIIAPDVKGRVTVRMVNIPWDQAMDIILKMNGLGYAMEDNVLRIASAGALTREAEEEMRTKEAKKKAEDLVTRIVPINYSTAGAIEGTIKKSLSPRGETVTDARTNTLIIRDIARNVDEAVSLIKLLDKPIPQIMIEARIVEANTNFSRQIGIQWGGAYKADAAHGNTPGYSFPSSIGVTGGPSMGSTASGNGNYFVNMPAAAGANTGGGAIGMTFGSLTKALNLDLVLSALESTGEGKIISTPRVSALDNKEAKISQGISIPFSTTSAGGTQIQFIDAKLELDVTPHATPDNKIFMKITATKNAPDTSLLGASGQPSITKNEASTEILLADGETAVIGGILILNRSQAYTKVPFFGDLPLIGWLFRTKSNTESKQELLIFITPRIVTQEVI